MHEESVREKRRVHRRFEGFFMLAARFSSVAGSDRLIFMRRFPLLV